MNTRLLVALLISSVVATSPAVARDSRDVVFDCPCEAEWVPNSVGSRGRLLLTFGVRNHRVTETGEVELQPPVNDWPQELVSDLFTGTFDRSVWPNVGQIPPMSVMATQYESMPLATPVPGEPITIELREKVAEVPALTELGNTIDEWHVHERLTLWPTSEDEGTGRVHFVDILTDTDQDGVGDFNERLAGTSAEDASDTPGDSTIDVLAVYDAGARKALAGYPFTRIHHLMVLTKAIYADNETNIELRNVGMIEVEVDSETSRERPLMVDDLMAKFGADTTIYFFSGTACGGGGGCAPVGGSGRRGKWEYPGEANIHIGHGALNTAHELGHLWGLAHSVRQGEAYGAFRWSRGHHLAQPTGYWTDEASAHVAGTVMSYANYALVGTVFSDPMATCLREPCGVSAGEPGGANAVRSLDLLRFQIAAHHPPQPDSDGDGFVDSADAAPFDPYDWNDVDGDGLGDNADSDDDNDSVLDLDDAFPHDPEEWVDADGDGVGDNADDEVVDLAPFRDPALRAIVEEELKKSPGASITAADLESLKALAADGKNIRDLSGLELATNLETLDLNSNAVSNLSPLQGLTKLVRLTLNRNAVTDLSPLSGLTGIRDLQLATNPIDDLSPLAGLSRLRVLYVGPGSLLTLDDFVELPRFPELEILGLAGMAIQDISPLVQMTTLEFLDLRQNSISDLSPLTGMIGLRGLVLKDNNLSDISPLVNRSIWAREAGLWLWDNPLSRVAIDEHLPMLRSWGVQDDLALIFSDRNIPIPMDRVAFPDPVLRGLVAQSVAYAANFVDSPIDEETITELRTLHAFGRDVSDISGIEAAKNLESLYLGSNAIRDLSPLSDLPSIKGLDLSNNEIVDVSPLVDNSGIAEGDWVNLNGNPLSEESVNTHVPALMERGVRVSLDNLMLIPREVDNEAYFDTAGYFAAVLGPRHQFTAVVSNPARASAGVVHDSALKVLPTEAGGPVLAAITATDETGQSETLTFKIPFQITKQGEYRVSLFPGSSDPWRQGFVQVINHSEESGEALIEAIDDSGFRAEPVPLLVGPRQVTRFNTADLEEGNVAKGLIKGVGTGQGDWRLAIRSSLDLEVQSYIRTTDGFVTSMHDAAPQLVDGSYRVAFFNPGSNWRQVSQLRLVNWGDQEAHASITGVDDAGLTPGTTVRLSVPPGAAVTLSSSDLESGAGVEGALGDGVGKWRLGVVSDQPLVVMSLLESPTGHLTNLSKLPSKDASNGAPLFLSASDPLGRQGFVRVINRSRLAGSVRIDAVDDTDNGYDPVTLSLGAGEARQFQSEDLELGNVEKGLSGSTGSGQGDWRLKFSSDIDIDVLAYIRTSDGFVTSMHEAAPSVGKSHRVAIFNPASNYRQVSILRLTNRTNQAADVTVSGVDDAGESHGRRVRAHLAGNQSVAFSAKALEGGGEGFLGSLGNGRGKWRLQVHSRVPLAVMSLLKSPTGHISNLSTAPGRWAASRETANAIMDTGDIDLVSFQDQALHSAIENALGKIAGQPITRDELSALRRLEATNAGIQDLTGIEQAENLDFLNLCCNDISELSPLSNLAGLRQLSLFGNRISDLSPLSALIGLRTLQLERNEIADISPLSGLTMLEYLFIRENEIADILPLSALTELRNLDVRNNIVADVSPLSDLTNLQSLNISHNPIADLSQLSNLEALRSLYIGYTNLSLQDAVSLPFYREFLTLDLSGLGVTDVSRLSDLNHPRALFLQNNSISDLSPFATLTGVQVLWLASNQISDIAPLLTRTVWEAQGRSSANARLNLRDNSLNQSSIEEGIPTLQSWGIRVDYDLPD